MKNTLLCLALLSSTATAAANDDVAIARLLVCDVQADHRDMTYLSTLLQGRWKQDANGEIEVNGRIRAGTLCIENAHIGGTAGVITVAGSLCEAEAKPLIDHLEQTGKRLAQQPSPEGRGAIAVYEAPGYWLMLFHGKPDFNAKPDPASTQLSYKCAFPMSNPG